MPAAAAHELAGKISCKHLGAELLEIDENLCRSELTASQRAQAIKRRKAIWEALHPGETGGKNLPTCLSDGRKGGPQHEQGFAAETAAVSGESKRAINQHLARAEALGDDLPRVTGTSLDKGVELDALAKLPSPPVAVQRLGPGYPSQVSKPVSKETAFLAQGKQPR